MIQLPPCLFGYVICGYAQQGENFLTKNQRSSLGVLSLSTHLALASSTWDAVFDDFQPLRPLNIGLCLQLGSSNGINPLMSLRPLACWFGSGRPRSESPARLQIGISCCLNSKPETSKLPSFNHSEPRVVAAAMELSAVTTPATTTTPATQVTPAASIETGTGLPESQLSPFPAATLQSPLESLPVEIQRLILIHSPTFGTLRALVHASPRLHAVYTADRLRILRGFVEQSLDDLLIDAHAAYLSGKDEFQLNREMPMLWEFVHAYEQRHAAVEQSEIAAQLTLEELVQLVRFHGSVVEFLTERYAVWALAALSSSPEAQPISATERRRIQRGIYRLQIFCNICGTRGAGRSSPNCITHDFDRIRVLGLFPAWQVEEIFCVHEFVKDSYGGIFDQVAWDLNEERNPRYSHLRSLRASQDLMLFEDTECCQFDPSVV
jgi:hypothetical protein